MKYVRPSLDFSKKLARAFRAQIEKEAPGHAAHVDQVDVEICEEGYGRRLVYVYQIRHSDGQKAQGNTPTDAIKQFLVQRAVARLTEIKRPKLNVDDIVSNLGKLSQAQKDAWTKSLFDQTRRMSFVHHFLKGKP